VNLKGIEGRLTETPVGAVWSGALSGTSSGRAVSLPRMRSAGRLSPNAPLPGSAWGFRAGNPSGASFHAIVFDNEGSYACSLVDEPFERESDGGWPFHPTNTLGYFPGSIAIVAFYRSQHIPRHCDEYCKLKRKLAGWLSWIPFCSACSTVVVALGIAEALAYASLKEWANAAKALLSAGVNALFGGLKLTKDLEYLEGGASGVVAREVVLKLEGLGMKAWNVVQGKSGLIYDYVDKATFGNKAVHEAIEKTFNLVGNLLTAPVSPGKP
jgi:hypothetical protein